MERIASFSVNHLILNEGIYLSRIDGDAFTYDIRLRKPNKGDYLNNSAIHTTEHLFATYVRNSDYSDKIIYFGPMGCRTGYYFIVRDMSGDQVIELVKSAFEFISDFEGEIPGTTAIECGNYLDHDLVGAKADAARFGDIIKDYTSDRLKYSE